MGKALQLTAEGYIDLIADTRRRQRITSGAACGRLGNPALPAGCRPPTAARRRTRTDHTSEATGL